MFFEQLDAQLDRIDTTVRRAEAIYAGQPLDRPFFRFDVTGLPYHKPSPWAVEPPDRIAGLDLGAEVTPLWSADGRTLYYQKGDSLLAAEVGGTDSLRVARRRVVLDSLDGRFRDIHPDGRRILVQESGSAVRSDFKIIAVTGWLDAVLRKPSGGERR